jgi:hypothetical protein
MAQWVQREHGKGEIDRAGAILIPWWKDPDMKATDQIAGAYDIVQNWRTSHALPLNVFQAGLRWRARRVEADVVVAQRLKRFSSVMNKLVREPFMKLSQMQDLGGCRAILSDVSAVYRLYEMYRKDNLHASEGTLKCYDYIRQPKADGYRSIHIIGRYSARTESRQAWNSDRIEIQLRSRLQHAFATAVETVTTFTREPLKFGAGPAKWRRFFSLMGSALALREGTELVEGTPSSAAELTPELRYAAKVLKVHKRLRGWTKALTQLPRKNIIGFKWLLLVLNTTENTIKVSGYTDRREADKTVAEIEQSKRKDLDAVLVWVNSIRQLRAAYPNYYADTREFIAALDLVLKGQRRETANRTRI